MADTQADHEFELRRAYVRGFSDAVTRMHQELEEMRRGLQEQELANAQPTGTPLPLDAPLVLLDLEPSIYNPLTRWNFRTIGDVIQAGEVGMKGIRNLGPKGLQKLKLALAKAGHQLT